MINIKELSGHRLRKDLCLKYVVKRWHNHNKTGGNFGINLITGGERNFEITGYHNIEGKITTLQFKHLYGQTIYANAESIRNTTAKEIAKMKSKKNRLVAFLMSTHPNVDWNLLAKMVDNGMATKKEYDQLYELCIGAPNDD